MRKTEICLVCFVLFYSIGLFNTGKFPKTVSYDQNTHSLQGNSLHRAPLSNVCPHQCIPLDTRPAEKLILRISPILQHFSKSHGFEKWHHISHLCLLEQLIHIVHITVFLSWESKIQALAQYLFKSICRPSCLAHWLITHAQPMCTPPTNSRPTGSRLSQLGLNCEEFTVLAIIKAPLPFLLNTLINNLLKICVGGYRSLYRHSHTKPPQLPH